MTDSSLQERISGSRMLRFRKEFSGWLVIIPAVILFGFFIWVPLIEIIRLSLYTSVGIDVGTFVGLDNFKSVITDGTFMPALRNTVMYTVWSLLIGFLCPIIMAMFLNEVVHLKGLFRVGSYLPNMTPGLATVVMWSFLFLNGPTGVVNIVFHVFGIAPVNWLSTPSLVIPVIVITMTWKGAGATALIYLAGLQGINPELYEASAIDGAGIWNRIWHITLPNIYNLGRTLLILQIITVFQILYEPMVMTQGGPNHASISLMELMYNYIFTSMDYASASAVSVVVAVLLIIFTAVYNIVAKRKDM